MDCLFCRIAAGEIGCRQVYADDRALAFLDIEPFQRGHTLVIPRRHVADITADQDALAEIAPACSAVARMMMDRLGCAGVNMLSNAGKAAGQEVFHLHVHLVPRYADKPGLRALFADKHRAGEDELDEVLTALGEK